MLGLCYAAFSPAVANRGHSLLVVLWFSLWQLLLLQSMGSRARGLSTCSLLVAHRLSCSAAWGLFPDQGLNRCLLLCQFSSVTQSCLTLCDPMDCSMPGFPVHHQLPELTPTHHTLSNHLISVVPFSLSCLQSFSASGYFLMSQLFTSGGQSIGASASVLPMNIED